MWQSDGWRVRVVPFLACVFGLLLLMACTGPAAGPPSSPESVPGNDLLVAAAANVQFAFTEIGQRFEEQTGHHVVFSFGSSGNLTSQIENGAPFDVFAAANVGYVDKLREKGLIIPETQHVYAQGRLVLVVNRQSGVKATKLEDLLDPSISRVAIANPEHAPYGLAARQALQNAGLWDRLQTKIVYGENVRQTLQFVQTGDAPAGLVALSIADVPEVSRTLVDAGLYSPLNQAMAVIRGAAHEQVAREFVDFVMGSRGQSILERYGYSRPGGS